MSLLDQQRATSWLYLIILSLSFNLIGCEDSPQDKLREARGALASGNIDVAETRLNEVIAADPDRFEAHRLMADVHMRRGDFEVAEEALHTLWEDEGLENDGELDATQRRTRGLISDQFNSLYRNWAEALDQSDSPELFEQVARKGLERDSRNARLNALLADFHQERAERYVERGEKIKAAEELEKIEDLRIFADVRRETSERARNLRREVFAEDARQRFEENLQQELVESDAYDVDRQRLRIAIEQTVDRGLDPGSEEGRAQAQRIALQTLAPTLAQLAISLTGLQIEEIELSELSTPEISVEDENFRPGRYDMVAVFSLDALIGMAFDYAEFERTRARDDDEEEAEELSDQADQASEEVAEEGD